MISSRRVFGMGLLLGAGLLVAPAAVLAFDLDFSPWPNVHWPSPTYHFTYGDQQGNYTVYYPGGMGKSYLVTPADLAWLRNPRTALVEVILPDADAVLIVQGKTMATKGTRRRFVSPSLAPGEDYTYELQARWDGAGKPVEQTRRVTVRAGERVTADFTAPLPR